MELIRIFARGYASNVICGFGIRVATKCELKYFWTFRINALVPAGNEMQFVADVRTLWQLRREFRLKCEKFCFFQQVYAVCVDSSINDVSPCDVYLIRFII